MDCSKLQSLIGNCLVPPQLTICRVDLGPVLKVFELQSQRM